MKLEILTQAVGELDEEMVLTMFDKFVEMDLFKKETLKVVSVHQAEIGIGGN